MTSPITEQSTVASLVDFWLEQLRAEGRLDRTTINEYERVLRKLVVPRLGSVRLHALTTERVNVFLGELGNQSLNAQRKSKVVFGAMLDAAFAHAALRTNPARGSLSISRPKTDPRTLTNAEVEAVRAAVRAWLGKERSGPKSSRDMADIVDLMLATGARIGEVLALRWRDVDLDARTIEINATVKTEAGTGTYRKLLPRSRSLELPTSAVEALKSRRKTIRENHLDAVFPTRNITWHQVNNIERRWRQIRREAGLEWVTPELFRRQPRPDEPPRRHQL
ncbi:MAG TPA: tyrosine-type recombinase/integrase [Nocardioidaceae bacterium]|nr:tyrosine-type recombinase/integrase [Nocardioidaceae bacterium]